MDPSLERSAKFILPGVDGNPSKVISLNEIADIFKSMQNMELAHEIALNPEFKLQPYNPPENSLEHRIKQIMHTIFWDTLRDEINSNPPCYDRAIQLLNDIKEYFPHILSPANQRALEHINETLDEKVILQQAENGVLDFFAYASFIINILAKSCAPVRDEAVAKLSKIDDVVDTFRGILETMALMKLDMANFILETARNEILAHSVEYEKQKFKEFLSIYNSGFPATLCWLRRNQKLDENNKPVSTPEQTINAAYMELVFWDKKNIFPEVISMDKERFLKLSDRANRLIVAASLMSISSGFSMITGREEIRKSIKKLIEILLHGTNTDEGLSDEVENFWVQTLALLRTYVKISDSLISEIPGLNTFKTQILQISNKDAPVRNLMKTRLRSYVELCLRSPGLHSAPAGYVEFKNELEIYTISVKRCIAYNHSIFGQYFYDLLIKESVSNSNHEVGEKSNFLGKPKETSE